MTVHGSSMGVGKRNGEGFKGVCKGALRVCSKGFEGVCAEALMPPPGCVEARLRLSFLMASEAGTLCLIASCKSPREFTNRCVCVCVCVCVECVC
jgi:hypothetical protein